MNSRIEQIIEEIEEYIEGCKPPRLSNGSKIIVDRETMEELLNDLRSNTPEEIKRYQKIISNKEAIMADAHTKAEQMLQQAQVQTTELISEHEIMQQAYAQASEVVRIATKEAQEILDNATADANAIRMSAITYTDDILKNLEEIISGSIETQKARSESLVSSLQGYLDVVLANRSELVPQELEGAKQQESQEASALNAPFQAPGENTGL